MEGDDQDDPILVSLKDRYERLQGLRARLMSGRTSAFVLVLIPERLPIEETARALTQLDDTGIKVGGLVVNRVLPRETTDAFLQQRRAQEQIYLDEIARRFADRPRVYLPQFPRDVYGLASLGPVAEALAVLTKLSPHARMTGSGACVFAPFAREDDAAQAVIALPAGLRGRVVRTLARHPLAAFA